LSATAAALAVVGWAGIAGADPGKSQGKGQGVSQAPGQQTAPSSSSGTTATTQVPSGSNGVNHNDTPLPGNPNCSNSNGTSGQCSSPQPASTADQTGNGANPGPTNTNNPYGSTRNGAASDNGSGTGKATGRPCAGCVGKADNKNPHAGQSPNGPTDHNNGYECDGNNGIGQTNPAHTGCKSSSGGDNPPPDGNPPGNPPGGNNGGGNGNTTCDSGSSAAACNTAPEVSVGCDGGVFNAASAACTEVLGITLVNAPVTPQVLGEALTASSPKGTLPETGANVALLIELALSLCGAGGGLLLVRRRMEAGARV